MAIKGTKKKEDKPLYRTFWFYVELPVEQLALVMGHVMPVLTEIWNQALLERIDLDARIKERLEREVHPLMQQAKKNSEEAGWGAIWSRKHIEVTDVQWKEKGCPPALIKDKKEALSLLYQVYGREILLWTGVSSEVIKEGEVKAGKETMLIWQINQLTGLRADNPSYEAAMRTSQEETLKTLHGAWLSFLQLRGAGDKDAKPPSEREAGNFFHTIPNRTGFNKETLSENGRVEFRLGRKLEPLVFQVPDNRYCRQCLLDAVNFRQIVLSRRSEVGLSDPDLAKPGQFKLSVSYNIRKPATLPLLPENTVYLAVGASRLGVFCAKEESCRNLPRPDYHWKPLINELDGRIKQVLKGSRKWKRRSLARALMFSLMANQQKLAQCQTVRKLLKLGCHFVVTELKVRSKLGALADASKPGRGGAPTGGNWAAQNTGNIGRFFQRLADKAAERGGSVIKRNPPLLSDQERQLPENQRKIRIAQNLRKEFLAI